MLKLIKGVFMEKIKKQYVIWALIYLVVGIICGVYYREFTKALNYTNVYTPLGLVHPHFLVLGMIMTLLLGFLVSNLDIKKTKTLTIAFWLYNVGVIFTATMLLIRGTLDVLVKSANHYILSSAASGAISGISGVGHIILAAGIIMYFVLFILSYKQKKPL